MFGNKWESKYKEAEKALYEANNVIHELQKEQKELKEKIREIREIEVNSLEEIIKEQKLRLDIAEKFETIDRIESYLKNFSILFKFSDLMEHITPTSDLSVLIQEKSRQELEKATEFLQSPKKPKTTTALQEKIAELRNELDVQRNELQNKVNSLTLRERFNDETLHRYFKLTELNNGYSVDAFIAFEDCEEILIPSSYRGKMIIALKEKLFYNNKNLHTLVIEAPIRIIPSEFSKESSVKLCVLPNSVTKIENSAFSSSGLSEMILSKNLEEICDFAFSYTKLKNIDLPLALVNIGKSAFCNTLLESVILPLNLKELQSSCFSQCNELRRVILNERLQSIKFGAFSFTTSLQEITLPSGIVEIADDIFGRKSLGNMQSKTLKCYAGSYAQQWGREHGYTIKNAEED